MTELALLGLLHIAALGQALFVILWACLPFWREWIGRALMVKSIALGLFLWHELAAIYNVFGYQAHEEAVEPWLFALVTLGIVSQVVALIREMLRAQRGDRYVTGTERARL